MSLKFEQIMELIKSDDLCAEELQVGIKRKGGQMGLMTLI